MNATCHRRRRREVESRRESFLFFLLFLASVDTRREDPSRHAALHPQSIGIIYEQKKKMTVRNWPALDRR